jgi:hypothetical protein
VPTQAKYVLLIFILSFSRAVKKWLPELKKARELEKCGKLKNGLYSTVCSTEQRTFKNDIVISYFQKYDTKKSF